MDVEEQTFLCYFCQPVIRRDPREGKASLWERSVSTHDRHHRGVSNVKT